MSLPAVLLPQLKNGKWVRAAINGKAAAELRKSAILNGRLVEGADLSKGEWDPNWTRHNKAVVVREPKGTIRDRHRAERVKKIEDSMETMQQRIQDMHAARISGKPVSTYDRQLRDAGVIKDKSVLSKEQKEEEKMRLKKEAKAKKENNIKAAETKKK